MSEGVVDVITFEFDYSLNYAGKFNLYVIKCKNLF